MVTLTPITTIPATQPLAERIPTGTRNEPYSGDKSPAVGRPASEAVPAQENAPQALNGVERAAPQTQGAVSAAHGEQEGNGEQGAFSRQAIEKLAERIEASLAMLNRNLHFQIDEETKKLVIKVVDVATKEVIKQIPPQELIEIAKALDKVQGLFVREKA